MDFISWYYRILIFLYGYIPIMQYLKETIEGII